MNEPHQAPAARVTWVESAPPEAALQTSLPPPNTVHALNRLASLAATANVPRVADEAGLLAARAGEGRFYVACVGQFKRGKSTLIDALIGDRVLPTGVVPVTSVPTVVRHGERRAARVRDHSGSWYEIAPELLAAFVSEEQNPENEMGITGVEVFVPSLLLESGMCLVDTPGLGSTFERSTAATHAFVPHIDAAIAVIGADPPLTGAELDLLETVAHEVPDLIFVLNKADRMSALECSEGAAFARVVLKQRLGHPVERIFEVSARERLDRVGPPRDWDAFVDALNDLASRSGPALAVTAAERGLSRLGAQFLTQLAEERNMLVRPIEESERRADDLARTVSEAEQSLSDLGHLFAAEQERLAHTFAERRMIFLARVRPLAAGELAAELRSLPRDWGPALRREAMQVAQEVARGHVIPWLNTEQEEAERSYRRTAERFVALADEFLDRVGTSGPETAYLPHTLDAQLGFVTRSRFYFNDMIRLARPASPFRFALDALLGTVGLIQPIIADAGRFLGWLLEMNSTRVESDLNDRVLESRRRLETSVRTLLQDVRTSAEQALARAKATRAAGIKAVQQELGRIARLEREVGELVIEAEHHRS